MACKQCVFLCESNRTNEVFDSVRVDLDPAIGQENL
jgi:hypothetical protein